MSESPVVLITGAATGVGRACASKFAHEGFDVAVNYLGPEEEAAAETRTLVEAESQRALLLQCDVSQDLAVRQMVQEIDQEFGRLDALVNCAGTTHFVDHPDLDGMTEEMWDQILAVNTKGPFFVSRACVPLLRQQPNAAIVSISSVAGLSGFGSSIAYCASKGALNTMTKSLARALAPEVRVNAVCPGPIDSDWLRRGLTDQQIQQRVESFPLPRLSQPKDIADAVFYLARGTDMTTGQLLVVDGGRTM